MQAGGMVTCPLLVASSNSCPGSRPRIPQGWVNVSHVLATLPVGLEPLASGTWNVFFGPVHLGWLDERDDRIHDHRG